MGSRYIRMPWKNDESNQLCFICGRGCILGRRSCGEWQCANKFEEGTEKRTRLNTVRPLNEDLSMKYAIHLNLIHPIQYFEVHPNTLLTLGKRGCLRED